MPKYVDKGGSYGSGGNAKGWFIAIGIAAVCGAVVAVFVGGGESITTRLAAGAAAGAGAMFALWVIWGG